MDPGADLDVAQQVLTQFELHPHVGQVDQRDQRDAGQNKLPVLDRDAEHLAVGGRHNDHLIDQRLKGFHAGLRRFDLRLRDAEILARVARDGLLVREPGLLEPSLRHRERRRRAVQVCHRSVVSGDQRALAVIGLLRQREVGLGAFGLRLAHGDGLGAKPSLDARQFGLRHRQVGRLCASFAMSSGFSMRIRDAPCFTFCDRVDVDLGDAAVDAGGHVEGPGLHFALHDQWFAPGEVPDRQADHRQQQDRHNGDRYDPSSGPGRARWSGIFRHGLMFLRRMMDVACRNPRRSELPALLGWTLGAGDDSGTMTSEGCQRAQFRACGFAELLQRIDLLPLLTCWCSSRAVMFGSK